MKLKDASSSINMYTFLLRKNLATYKYAMTFICSNLNFVYLGRTEQSWQIRDGARISPTAWQKWLVSTGFTAMGYLCHKLPWKCSACRNHHSVLTYLRVCNKSNTRVSLMEEELPTLPELLSSPRFSVGFLLSRFSFLCSVL
jgi:hypothetical protein